MKILITGATGNIGRQLVNILTDTENEIIAAVHSKEKAKKTLPHAVQMVEMDFLNRNSIDAAMMDVNRIFLLTPFVPNQIEMVKNIVDIAKKNNITHIVKQSFFGVKDKSLIAVAKYHREAEEYIESSGIPFTFLRPTSFMQNFINNFSQPIKQYRKFFMPLGENKVAYIDARDIAEIAAVALTTNQHMDKKYQLTGPEALSGKDVAHIFSEVLEKQIEYVSTSDEQASEGMRQMNMPDWIIDILIEMNQSMREGKQANVTKTIEDILKRKPKTFKMFLEDYKGNFV